jgi:hypothetical protein
MALPVASAKRLKPEVSTSSVLPSGLSTVALGCPAMNADNGGWPSSCGGVLLDAFKPGFSSTKRAPNAASGVTVCPVASNVSGRSKACAADCDARANDSATPIRKCVEFRIPVSC